LYFCFYLGYDYTIAPFNLGLNKYGFFEIANDAKGLTGVTDNGTFVTNFLTTYTDELGVLLTLGPTDNNTPFAKRLLTVASSVSNIDLDLYTVTAYLSGKPIVRTLFADTFGHCTPCLAGEILRIDLTGTYEVNNDLTIFSKMSWQLQLSDRRYMHSRLNEGE
jgi:hypothetical protein